MHLFQDDPSIDSVRQVHAGKYRRYSGLTRLQRLLDISTFMSNARDVGRVCRGYAQALKLLKELKPDGVVIKGGFVGVPIGLAAAHLNIPFITHDSDSTPGLANRIIAKWAHKHATGMPVEFYTYPTGSMVYTGVPISNQFVPVTSGLQQQYKESVGLAACTQVITVIGGSQGGGQLNEDIAAIIGRLMQQHHNIGLVHIVGPDHETTMQHHYANELLADELRRVVIKSFVSDVYRYTGAADVVVSRASATVVAELAVQGKATILVPGQLADDHQVSNARHLSKSEAVIQVDYGDREGLFTALNQLLGDAAMRQKQAASFQRIAKPDAAKDLALLAVQEFTH